MGKPLYEPENPHILTSEEKKEYLIRDLDCVDIINGKEFFEYGNRYFATDENGRPDLSHILTLSPEGEMIKREVFTL